LFRSRQFKLLFAGTAANAIGTWAALLAMWGYAAYKFDSGPTQLAYLGLAWSAPSALLGPLAGVPIDRYGPRRVLLWAYTASSFVALTMAFTDTYGQLLALGGLYGLVHTFTHPATASLPPRLVEDRQLVAANALLGAADESAIIFGPLLAAAVIAVWGVGAAFIADAVTYWVAIAVLLPLRLQPVTPAPRTTLRHELLEGVRIARRQPVVRFTMLLSIAVFATWGSYFVIEPLYVRESLGESATMLGLLQTAFGVGMVGTGLLLPRIGERVARPRAVALSVMLSGVAAGIYVGTEVLFFAFLGVFLWGVDVAFFTAPSRTLLQRATPVASHGRVLALHNTLESWSDTIAIPAAGLAAAAFGVRTTGFIAGAIAIGAGLFGFLRAPSAPEGFEPTLEDAEPLPGIKQPA
jgi:DHA3 family macrolide efflux protein-like MFS transporter